MAYLARDQSGQKAIIPEPRRSADDRRGRNLMGARLESVVATAARTWGALELRPERHDSVYVGGCER